MTKNISVLGSTGSIGVQTLDVAEMHNIKVSALTANRNTKLLEQQARRFRPDIVAMADTTSANELKAALADTDIRVYGGEEGIRAAAQYEKADTVLNAIVGVAGLLPTLAAVEAGKDLALANKETLVAGGSIVKAAVRKNGVRIYPVDSEHSAIFQCLQGVKPEALKKVILTASGGAFFGRTKKELENVTVEQALRHPNWSMGAKITIDSATMMNKGLEVIEASYLFNVPDEKIDVLIHRESIIHSMIQLEDNAVIAQLGTADMRIPIQYALTYPERLPSPAAELDLAEISRLTFSRPDNDTFACLPICREALRKGWLYPAVANAANEAAVQLFLNRRISFLEIPEIVGKAVSELTDDGSAVTLEAILNADKETRTRIAASR